MGFTILGGSGVKNGKLNCDPNPLVLAREIFQPFGWREGYDPIKLSRDPIKLSRDPIKLSSQAFPHVRKLEREGLIRSSKESVDSRTRTVFLITEKGIKILEGLFGDLSRIGADLK